MYNKTETRELFKKGIDYITSNIDCEKDNRAEDIFNDILNNSEKPAYGLLGFKQFYFFKGKVDKEKETDEELFKVLTENIDEYDDSVFYAYLGSHYLENNDITKAKEVLKKGCDYLDGNCQYLLGSIYSDYEEDNFNNKKEAFKYFKYAVKNGNEVAKINLALCYQNGLGTYASYSLAFKYMEEAYDYLKKTKINLYNKAAVYLGIYYENGIGVEQNGYKALSLFKEAAENNYPDGLFHLARCYNSGLFGLDRDREEAFKLATRAYEKGSDDARKLVATMYLMGYGTGINEKKGFELLGDYENTKDEVILYNLALYYMTKEVPEKDMALKYLSKGIELGYPDCKSLYNNILKKDMMDSDGNMVTFDCSYNGLVQCANYLSKGKKYNDLKDTLKDSIKSFDVYTTSDALFILSFIIKRDYGEKLKDFLESIGLIIYKGDPVEDTFDDIMKIFGRKQKDSKKTKFDNEYIHDAADDPSEVYINCGLKKGVTLFEFVCKHEHEFVSFSKEIGTDIKIIPNQLDNQIAFKFEITPEDFTLSEIYVCFRNEFTKKDDIQHIRKRFVCICGIINELVNNEEEFRDFGINLVDNEGFDSPVL